MGNISNENLNTSETTAPKKISTKLETFAYLVKRGEVRKSQNTNLTSAFFVKDSERDP